MSHMNTPARRKGVCVLTRMFDFDPWSDTLGRLEEGLQMNPPPTGDLRRWGALITFGPREFEIGIEWPEHG
jgi:hypothetical protein